MNLTPSPQLEAFRAEVRSWLDEQLAGSFAEVRGRGGPGDEEALFDERWAWERALGEAGWIGLGWPAPWGAGADLYRQVVFEEEHARARAPGRVGHIGEKLLAPTLCAFGTEAQKQRFLPPIKRGEELWCQGYSEPDAGSDLAGVRTRAVRDGDGWRITGQKIWTSLAHRAQWCFALCRTDPDARRHAGLSYLLVPMDQPGIEVRPIEQMTGTSEFNEVFFDGARAPAGAVVGGEGNGWRVAMATLAFERGVSTLGQQLMFQAELDRVIAAARESGAARDPEIRRRLADAHVGLRVMRWHALRALGGDPARDRAPMVGKLYWSHWHRDLGELAMDVLGPGAEVLAGEPYQLSPLQRLFLFSRSDTIYAGSSEIQRNIIAERGLGLPRDG